MRGSLHWLHLQNQRIHGIIVCAELEGYVQDQYFTYCTHYIHQSKIPSEIRNIKGNTRTVIPCRSRTPCSLSCDIYNTKRSFSNLSRFVSLKTIASLRTHSRDHDKSGTRDHGVDLCRRCRNPSLLNVSVIWASMGVSIEHTTTTVVLV
jgi:hypothetical protein